MLILLAADKQINFFSFPLSNGDIYVCYCERVCVGVCLFAFFCLDKVECEYVIIFK